MKAHRAYPILAVLAVLILWQLIGTALKVPTWLLPTPVAVWHAGVSNWKVLLQNGTLTTAEILAGFGLSAAVAIPIAVAFVYSKTLDQVFYPLLVGSQVVPKIAIAPLLVVWLGFGDVPKILIAFLIAFFPIVIDTVLGLRSVDPDMLKLARSMGASQFNIFRKIRFPHALPNVFGGLKVAMTLAVIGAIVGEFVGSNSGLGYLLLVATGNVETALMFADIVLLTIIGTILFYAVEVVELAMTPWHVRS